MGGNPIRGIGIGGKSSLGNRTGLQGTNEVKHILENDRALAIGLLAALISVCVHNLVDDLYVHSLTNLMALLLIVLIRLEGVTTKVGGDGGHFDYTKLAK